jgi:hypothetical protein
MASRVSSTASSPGRSHDNIVSVGGVSRVETAVRHRNGAPIKRCGLAFELHSPGASDPLRHPFNALAFSLIAGLAAGCLFTSPINMPPMVFINAPLHVWHNQDALFSASVHDPDGNTVAVSFGYAPGDCAPTPPTPQSRFMLSDPNASFRVPASETAAPFCIWAFASDSFGATSFTPKAIQPEDHPPIADLQIVRPGQIAGEYPLYQEMKFLATVSDVDGDPTTGVLWKITAPQMSVVPAVALCADGSGVESDPFRCFVPTSSGEYRLEVTASSGPAGLSVSQSLTFTVAPDRLPCMANAYPDLATPSIVSVLDSTDLQAPLTFEVKRVDDDGDPYPRSPEGGGVTRFSWFVGVNNDPVVYRDNSGFPLLSIFPSDVRPGDVLRVRVEIHDRNVAAIDRILAGCGDDEAICPPASTCYQRKTWRVEVR